MKLKTYIQKIDTKSSPAGTKWINSQRHMPEVFFKNGDYREGVLLYYMMLIRPDIYQEVKNED